MNKKFKFRWSFMASSLILALFSLGVGGNAQADSASVTTPASAQSTAGSVASANSNESSLHSGDNQQWALQSSSQSTESVAATTASDDNLQSSSSSLAGWNAIDSSSTSSDSTSTSSSNSNGDTTTTYGNADDNNVDAAASSDASSSSSSAADSSSEPMLGLGDKGAAGAGTGADKTVKKIIDKVVPGGGLDNTKPDVPTNRASSTSSQQSAGSDSSTTDNSTAVQSAAGSQSASNSSTTSGMMAGVKRQTAIEKPNSSDEMAHNSFADRVSKSDTASAAKNNTKLVSFNTFSKLFYKQALNKKQNPGKFTTSKGKKVTITTPVSSVKYTDHDVNGIVETLPVIITLSIIGFVAISFIVFDPLRFIFR